MPSVSRAVSACASRWLTAISGFSAHQRDRLGGGQPDDHAADQAGAGRRRDAVDARRKRLPASIIALRDDACRAPRHGRARRSPAPRRRRPRARWSATARRWTGSCRGPSLVALDHRGGGLVAGRLDAEYKHGEQLAIAARRSTIARSRVAIPRHDPAHRHARQPAGAGAGAHGARRAGRRRTASSPTRIEIVVIRTTATASRTGRWRRPAARGCSPRRSRRRCSPAHRSRGAFLQGHADRAARRADARRLPAARGRARRVHQPQGARSSRELPQRRGGRHRVAAAAGAGEAAAARSHGRAAARQCRDAAAQARRRRGRRDAAGARRAEAARPRRRGDRAARRSRSFCRRSGRARSASRRAPTTRARATLLAPINHADTSDGARLRARVPRRARRLVPHADRRTRRCSNGDAICVSRHDRAAGRQRGVRDERATAAADDAAALGADAGRELEAPAPARFLQPDMRLLVTRPEPDASAPREALRARGHEVLVAPLLATLDDRGRIRRALGWRADDQRQRGARGRRASAPRRADALAVLHGRARAPPRRRGRQASPTRSSADGALGDLVRPGRAPGRSLGAAALSRRRGPRRRSGRRSGGRGIAVETAVVYRAVAAEKLPPDLTQALRESTLDAALHYSRRSAATLLALAGQARRC